MPHPLDSFFRPRSIAFVGATERSVWTRSAFENLKTLGYRGKLHLVNRKGGEVLGSRAAASIAAVGEPIDLALLMVPSEVLGDTFPDLQMAGVRNAVVLSSGFAESGGEGAARQQQLAASARTHGVRLLGPNCLGFVNFVDNTPVWTVSVRPQSTLGHIAIVSQSGALAAQMSYFGQWQGVALTYIISTGNEADVDVAQAIDYLVAEPATKSVALFLESVRDPAAFARAASRAFEAGKPIVVLKVGSSAVTAKAAQAHTGSLVGDDRVFDAVCKRYGMVRVQSLEDLIITAEVLARTGPLKSDRAALISLSGGLCEIAADRAEVEGIRLPKLSPATTESLKNALPGFGTPHNPLDVTGGVLLQPELLEKSLDVLARDLQFAAIVAVLDLPSSAADDSKLLRTLVGCVGAVQARSTSPNLLFSHTMRPMSELSREIVQQTGVNYLPCGVHHGLAAIGRAIAWSKLFAGRCEVDERRIVAAGVRPQSEHEALNYLSARGIPVIPARIAKTVDEAVTIARSLGGAVVLKISSPQIQHKTEVGGIKLNVLGDDKVALAYEAIVANATAAQPSAIIEGVAVSPMRTGDVELFVGTLRDAQWGAVIAVGLGGVWVEALQDTSLRLLPVTLQDVEAMFDELRGARLLNGFRGSQPVDRKAAASVIAAIGDATLALGPELVSLEVNPLLVSGSRMEVLDALIVWD